MKSDADRFELDLAEATRHYLHAQAAMQKAEDEMRNLSQSIFFAAERTFEARIDAALRFASRDAVGDDPDRQAIARDVKSVSISGLRLIRSIGELYGDSELRAHIDTWMPSAKRGYNPRQPTEGQVQVYCRNPIIRVKRHMAHIDNVMSRLRARLDDKLSRYSLNCAVGFLAAFAHERLRHFPTLRFDGDSLRRVDLAAAANIPVDEHLYWHRDFPNTPEAQAASRIFSGRSDDIDRARTSLSMDAERLGGYADGTCRPAKQSTQQLLGANVAKALRACLDVFDEHYLQTVRDLTDIRKPAYLRAEQALSQAYSTDDLPDGVRLIDLAQGSLPGAHTRRMRRFSHALDSACGNLSVCMMLLVQSLGKAGDSPAPRTENLRTLRQWRSLIGQAMSLIESGYGAEFGGNGARYPAFGDKPVMNVMPMIMGGAGLPEQRRELLAALDEALGRKAGSELTGEDPGVAP